MPNPNDKLYRIILALAVLVHASGLPVTIIGTDGTLYAVIAKTMAGNGNYLDLYVQGKDWLDKPHFPFWITAFSFELFGVNTFAYKFPAFVFTLLGAVYTYLFARDLYGKPVAKLAVLILLSAEHLILSSNDVRAEPYLTALMVIAVYYYYKASQKQSFFLLIPASLAAACAVMTKGIFVLIILGAAIGGGLIMKREWKQVFHWRWVAAGAMILLFIAPELYSLYSQFDLHPEKEVFGRYGVSGIRFFFWDSQFGRFNNTGPIKGSGSPLFFLHTLLWAFLPWCILFYAALIRKLSRLGRYDKRDEWFNFFGAVTGVLLFSLSSFQLPHYTNILFPFFAILTAGYMAGTSFGSVWGKVLSYFHFFVFVLLCCLPVVLFWLIRPLPVEPLHAAGFFLVTFGALALIPFIRKRCERRIQLVYFSVTGIVIVNVFLNLIFYPFLLRYQSGSEAAFWVNRYHPDAVLAHYQGGPEAFAFEFYADRPVAIIEEALLAPGQPVITYVAADRLEELENRYRVTVLKQFPHYHISKLSGKFLHAETRDSVLKEYLLVLVEEKAGNKPASGGGSADQAF